MGVETVAEYISRVGNTKFADRKGMPDSIRWISENPEAFNYEILPAFAQVVRKLNRMLTTDDVPTDCVNTVKLKSAGIKLPNLSTVIDHFSHYPDAFLEILSEVNYRMAKGESGDKADGKYFTFQDWVKRPDDRIVAAVIDISELLFWGMRGEEPENTGIIANALVEALAELGSNNPLYTPLISRERANFVYGYDGFSPEFRLRVVGEQIV